MAIKCGNCDSYHPSVKDVKACYDVADSVPTPEPGAIDPFARLDSYERAMVAGSPRQGRQRVPISEAQRSYILSLSSQKLADWTASAEQVAEVDALSKSEASARITALKAMPYLPKKSADAPATDLPEIPDGHYALTGEDGIVRFYSVKAGGPSRSGKDWTGYTFIKGLIGSPGSWTEIRLGKSERATVQERIGADWMAALKLYADKFERCGFCDSPLSDVRSRAARYGETCAGNHGLHYPTKAEAIEILGERVTAEPAEAAEYEDWKASGGFSEPAESRDPREFAQRSLVRE